MGLISKYPTTNGSEALRQSIAGWVNKRFSLENAPINPETQVIPVNGTREAILPLCRPQLFGRGRYRCDAKSVLSDLRRCGVFGWISSALSPNLPSGQPDYLAVPDSVERLPILLHLYPGQPNWNGDQPRNARNLILKANEFDFWLASDECYSEIYRDSPPPGLLQVCAKAGNTDYSKCIVFHSLSKRSNLPGLRSGFVAGDSKFISHF